LMNQHRFGTWGAIKLRAAGPKLTAERFAPYLTHLGMKDPVVLFKLLDSMRTHSAEDLLPHIAVPLLICAGEKDYFCPPVTQQRMHDLAPDSELVWFPEGHHTLPLDEPEALEKAIAEFLDRRLEPGGTA